jgi:hypothetical protein
LGNAHFTGKLTAKEKKSKKEGEKQGRFHPIFARKPSVRCALAVNRVVWKLQFPNNFR